MSDWDERYRLGEGSGKGPEPLLISAVSGHPPGKALDLACGLGRNSIYLAEQGWTVTAVDYSEVALSKVPPHRQIVKVMADLESGEYTIRPDSFDLVVDCCYLQRNLFPALRAGLRSGGLFVGVFPMEGVRPAFQIRPGELREEFKDWEILHFQEGHRAEIAARKPRVL